MALANCAWTGIGRKDNIRNYATNVSLYDEESAHLVLLMTGLRHNELEVDVNVHKPYNYVRSCWMPDVSLLSNADLGSLRIDSSDTSTLARELSLPKPAVGILALIKHKTLRLFVLEVELGGYENTMDDL